MRTLFEFPIEEYQESITVYESRPDKKGENEGHLLIEVRKPITVLPEYFSIDKDPDCIKDEYLDKEGFVPLEKGVLFRAKYRVEWNYSKQAREALALEDDMGISDKSYLLKVYGKDEEEYVPILDPGFRKESYTNDQVYYSYSSTRSGGIEMVVPKEDLPLYSGAVLKKDQPYITGFSKDPIDKTPVIDERRLRIIISKAV